MGNKGALRLGLLAATIGGAFWTGVAPAAAQPPTNDNFASAQDVSATPTVTGTNSAATAEAGEPDHGNPNNLAATGSCSSGVSADGVVNPEWWSGGASTGYPNPPLQSVWFKWTAPSTGGCVTFDTFGSTFDTVLAVYTGSGYGKLTLIAGNDDANSACVAVAHGSTQTSCVRFAATAGTTYYIALDEGATQFGGNGSGQYTLDWSLDTAAPDLAVSRAAHATSVHVRDSIPYTITVANDGTADAPNSTLADTLSGPGTITAITATQGSCAASTTSASCSFGTIPRGSSVAVTMTVQATAAGAISNSSTVSTTGVWAPEHNVGQAPDVAVTPAPSGCTQVGQLFGDGNWTVTTRDVRGHVQLHNVHVDVSAACALDPLTHAVTLLNAYLLMNWDVLGGGCYAQTNAWHSDVTGVTIVGNTATITGTCGGQPFTVTLGEGGDSNRDPNHGDTMSDQWGALTTAPLTPTRIDVLIGAWNV